MRLFWKKKIGNIERINNERYWPLNSRVDALEYRIGKLEVEKKMPKAYELIESNERLSAAARCNGWVKTADIIDMVLQALEKSGE